jgi:hypothetical protein
MSHLDGDSCLVAVRVSEPRQGRGLCGHILRNDVLECMGHYRSISNCKAVLNYIFVIRFQEVAEMVEGSDQLSRLSIQACLG